MKEGKKEGERKREEETQNIRQMIRTKTQLHPTPSDIELDDTVVHWCTIVVCLLSADRYFRTSITDLFHSFSFPPSSRYFRSVQFYFNPQKRSVWHCHHHTISPIEMEKGKTWEIKIVRQRGSASIEITHWSLKEKDSRTSFAKSDFHVELWAHHVSWILYDILFISFYT